MAAREEIRGKFLGSLLGVAIGDAIGASWEGHRMAADYEIERITSDSVRFVTALQLPSWHNVGDYQAEGQV